MQPKTVTVYRVPSYPDKLSLLARPSVLAANRPARWLSPAIAAAVAAALGAGIGGCASHEKPQTPAGNTTQVQPQDADTMGARLAGAPPMMHGTTEENLPPPPVPADPKK